MSILIKGMEMPSTGLYFISVDNTGGRDKTIVTVERMLGNHDVRQVIGSFELVPVPPHGDLIDREPFIQFIKTHWDSYDQWVVEQLEARPTIIPAEEGE